MKKSAPGAADAARKISGWALSESQQQRLARLTSKDTKSAWETTKRYGQRKNLSAEELRQAHHELMWEAFRAADFQPVGHSENEQEKAKLEQIGKTARRFAREIREVGTGGTNAHFVVCLFITASSRSWRPQADWRKFCQHSNAVSADALVE
jgi:hypothetical protein